MNKRSKGGAIAAVLGAITASLLLLFVLQAFGLFSSAFFGPREEAVRRRIFEQSQAYNAGMIRDLENLKLDYLVADEAHRAALRGVILHRFSSYGGRPPPDLETFYNSLQGTPK